MTPHPLRVGLFGIGLEAYWPQFEGLKPKLEGYLGQVAGKLGRLGVEVCNLGLVDSPEKAMEAGHAMRRNDVGAYAFSSWTLHMASIIIFSTLWGLVLHEWRGSGRRTMKLVWLGLFILVASTIIVGYGNYLGGSSGGH